MSKETYTLQYPFEFDGEEVTELTLRRLKRRDLKKFEKIKSNTAKVDAMIADLAEVSPNLVDELDAVDIRGLSDVLVGFMGLSEDEMQQALAQSASS